MSAKKSIETFINECIKIHGNDYDYSKVEYKNNYTHVLIYCNHCKKHFLQTPKKHLAGQGCPFCVTDRIRKKMLFLYGKENAFQVKEFKEKSKKTCLEKYGVEYASQNKEIIKKQKNTFLEKYGVDNPQKNFEIKQKTKETCLERYGVDTPSKSEKIKEKIKITNMKKYGVTCSLLNEEIKNKIKQTILQEYKVENVFQSEEIKQKIRNKNKNKFGVIYYTQTKEFKEKSKKTCLEKYGVEHASQNKEIIEKTWNSRKKNNTCNSSKIEEKINTLLKEKFNNVKRNHKSELYPFHCDFYIPEKDLYIEYQGHPSHGNEPFDEQSNYHKQVLETWKQKAIEIENITHKKSQYSNYIHVWTIKDPLKRETARKNNLNWIEFFTMDEFMKWYDLFS